MKLLVTGGAGFIGSHFIRLILEERPGWLAVNLDNLSYAGNLATIKDLESPHHHFVQGDICDTALVEKMLRDHKIDAILNFAAESHVDRSIQSAAPFIRANILGTESLLAAARLHNIPKYIQISTDEVYGSANDGESFGEHATLCPNNPYSASKAAADHMVRAYHVTHGLPTCITRCTNNYGSFQYPEKFLPVVISKALANQKIPVYGDGLQKREWLHVSDHCRGILAVLEHGKSGEIYNISDDIDITNLDVAKKILSILDKPASLIQHVTDRPGHDRCYRVTSHKLRTELGWAPRVSFEDGLRDTVQWYQRNTDWIRAVLNPESPQDVMPAFQCRVCHTPDLVTFLKLGPTPAPNGFLSPSERHASEVYYPLDTCFCPKCGMVQLAHVVNPNVMFRDYDYIPSTSSTMTTHFTALAEYAIQKTALQKTDLVMDIGSNDGTLLKNFLKHGISVLGVDPAENLAQVANAAGVKTINALFTASLSKTLAEKQRAKVILGTNVFAHVPNVHDFLEGAKTLLTDDGVLIVEFPYLMDMIEKAEFDTIYQEHFSYFGLHPILKLVRDHNMGLVDATRTPVHGGSIRITISKTPCATPPALLAMIEKEKAAGLMRPETYFQFSKRVEKIRHDLVNLLWDLKASGKRIVGYGAPAKGNVLLNYCRIGSETIDYIVDSIPRKQGKFTPGTHLPIFPEAKLMEDKPDYALLLAWNFADEIMAKQTIYRQQGGKFILPIPDVKVV